MRIWFLVPCLAVLEAFAQRPVFGPTPAWVRPITAEGARVSDRTALQEGTEYTLLDNQYNVGTREAYVHSVLTLLDGTGVQNNSRISVDYDPAYQTLVFHSVNVIRGGKTINKYRADRVQVMHREQSMEEFLYDGTRTVVIEMDDVRPGDRVEQAWTIKGWNPSFGNRFHAYQVWKWAVPVGKQYLRFLLPNGRGTRISAEVGAPALVKSTIGTFDEYAVEATDIEAVDSEENRPPDHEVYPRYEATEFEDWDVVRTWAIDLFGKDQPVPKALQERIALINAEEPDATGRMDSVWHIVRDELRYLGLENGLSAYKPHPPEQVYAQRYGDCKDLSALLVTLLRAVGAEAWPALVNTWYGARLDRGIPRADVFNHCIVEVRHAGTTYWIDPTDSYARGTVLEHHMDDHGWVLVLDPARQGLDRMPAEDPGKVRTAQHLDIARVDGPATLDVVCTYEGRLADHIRAQWATQGEAETVRNYTEWYRGQFGEVEPDRPMEVKDDVIANRFTTTERYRLGNPWKPDIADSSKKVRTLTLEPGTLNDFMFVPRDPLRTAPFGLGKPVEVTEEHTVLFPVDWPVADQGWAADDHGIAFSYHVSGDLRTHRIEYHYVNKGGQVGPGQYAAFKAQQERIDDSTGRVWTWDPDAMATEERTPVKPHELAHWLLFLAFSWWVCKRLWRWDPEARWSGPQSRTIGGWLILPAIGLCFSPFVVVFNLCRDDFAMVTFTSSIPLISKDHPLLAHLYVYVSQLLLAFDLIFLPMLLVIFFKRRTSAPVLMAWFYAMNVASITFDAALYQELEMASWAGVYAWSDLSRAIVGAAIWIPYFLKSQRVRNTFVVRLFPEPPPLSPAEHVLQDPVPTVVDQVPPPGNTP